jgi:Ca2+-binding EF-hand superfamily protein
MSEQELQFHYFKMHDNDNNNKLDGCELIKSLIHWHVQEGEHQHGQAQKDPNTPPPLPKVFTEQEMVDLIDPIMNSDDANRDGFIDYAEFVAAQDRIQKSQEARV